MASPWEVREGVELGGCHCKGVWRQECSSSRQEHIQGRRNMVTMKNHLPPPLARESFCESAASSHTSYFSVSA